MLGPSNLRHVVATLQKNILTMEVIATHAPHVFHWRTPENLWGIKEKFMF